MRSAIVVLCTTLVLFGCGYNSDGPTYPSQVASVALTLSSSEAMTSAGDTRTVTAVVKDANQVVVSSPSLTWTSDSPAVATVVGTGATATITAVGDGETRITATAAGSVQGMVTVTVRRALATIVLTSPLPIVTVGAKVQLVATGLDARGKPLEGLTGFTYTSDNPGSAIVSNTGLVTALFAFAALPSAIITATVTKDGVTASDTAGVTVTAPVGFDFAALMLSDFQKPAPAPTLGAGIAYFTVTGTRIAYTIAWSGLAGPAVEAHLHGPGTAADVVGTLLDLSAGMQGTAGSMSGSFGAGDIRPQGGRPAISLDSLVKLLRDDLTYLDVHSQPFPNGEIRGQVAGPFR